MDAVIRTNDAGAGRIAFRARVRKHPFPRERVRRASIPQNGESLTDGNVHSSAATVWHFIVTKPSQRGPRVEVSSSAARISLEFPVSLGVPTTVTYTAKQTVCVIPENRHLPRSISMRPVNQAPEAISIVSLIKIAFWVYPKR